MAKAMNKNSLEHILPGTVTATEPDNGKIAQIFNKHIVAKGCLPTSGSGKTSKKALKRQNS